MLPSETVIISKTRIAFWLGLFFAMIFSLALIIAMILLSFKKGELDLRSVLFWMAMFSIIPFVNAFIGLLHLIRTIRVKEDHVVISYWFKRGLTIFTYADIASLDMKKYTEPWNGMPRSTYNWTVIRLKDGTKIEFERHQFANYPLLKDAIYRRWPENSL